MPEVTLPDGKVLNFDENISVGEIAKSIGPGLFKASLAGIIDGNLVDLSHEVSSPCKLELVTLKDAKALDVLRHSCAHILAQAVKRLYPKVQVTIGPVIDNGFYYDFSKDVAFSHEDLEKIEKEMEKIIQEDHPVARLTMTRDEAIEYFEKIGEDYKVQIIRDIPQNEVLSLYKQGEFVDLCRGPHIPSTGKIKAFKLMSVAGAYWRGDSKNEMLQRIYGTCWADTKSLKQYLFQIEEAEKRDHRKLAKKYNLFHMQEEAVGMVFWHPKGWAIYQELQGYIRKLIREAGYQEVNTPQLVERGLWERSGHWAKFRNEMFTLNYDEKDVAVKPMNCPCHVQIFKQGVTSYKDLPIRLAEFGSCHRAEPSGALHGILRTRNFVQDDAHIFCTNEQVQSEVTGFIRLLFKAYRDLGFEKILIKLSTRPENRVGSDEVWDQAEGALENALKCEKLDYELYPGEGAFYGPKIEFSLQDSLGRIWQCGTIQVDFSMPSSLGASYVAEDGSKKTPVMLHRAILGSFERFIGILIEETAGTFPVWLAPIQIVVMSITDKHKEYVEKLTKKLISLGLRAECDIRKEKISYKIREHTIQRVPYLVVIGDKELSSDQVSVRTCTGEDLGVMKTDEFQQKVFEEIQQYSRKRGG